MMGYSSDEGFEPTQADCEIGDAALPAWPVRSQGQAPANGAVWLPAKRAAFEIAPAPYTKPREREIVVRNRAVAINPVDWLTQSIGAFVFPWLAYPFILGSDVAGEIIEIGSGVVRFKVGDRVVGHAVGAHKSRNSAAEGGFQIYTVLLDHMAAPIPDGMAYANAAVLPLGLSTAACALFQKDQLALQHPSARPHPTGKTVLVWGGSTSVGGNAIQLAVAAGYEVIATASPKNFGYVKGLGASEAFDYRGRTVVADIVKTFAGRTIAGAIAIGPGSTKACLDILRGCKGDKFIAIATPPVPFDDAPLGRGRIAWLVPRMARMIGANIAMMVTSRLRGISTKFIFGTTLVDNEVGRMIYAEFLPSALAEGRYVAAPDPLILGHGLYRIPAAMAAQKQGVSAKKLVVTL
jgi:NADPH:quinone reductase-like Zn-dependent oxidoreductase